MDGLAKVIVNISAFLELSGDDVIDPDSAIKVMEMIGDELCNSSPEEKNAISKAAKVAAEDSRSRGSSGYEIKFFEEFMVNFGLDDEN